MKSIAWILKYIIFPLSPFFLGALVRGLHEGFLNFIVFSPTELSFSMAMLSLCIAINASRIREQENREALTNIFQLSVVISLSLFAWASFIETDINHNLNILLNNLNNRIQTEESVKYSYIQRINEFKIILIKLRIAAFVLASIIVPLAIYSNHKYELEDL